MKFLVFLFLSWSVHSFSQTLFGKNSTGEPVLTAKQFEKGIYTQFSSLLREQPVISGKQFDTLLPHIRDAIYCESVMNWRDASYDEKDPFYPCVRSENKLGKMLYAMGKISMDTVWGYNDGSYIYARIRDNFYPVVAIGSYCLINYYKSYREWKTAVLYGEKMRQFLFSSETGQIVELTNASLLKVLARDPGLLKEYNSKKHSEKTNAEFILRYNLEHPLKY